MRQDAMIAISEEKAENAKTESMKAMSKVMMLKSVVTREAQCAKMLESLGASFKGDCDGVRERAEDAKRRADENLEGAKKNAKDIMTLMDKSHSIQSDLTKMLSNVKLNVHL